ncbi:efflux transporter outer membrane subunit [Uliginosibacterium sp. H1]|uniref:efflux transporter outer membrane subunit n=1 Tax=Uliginosibacterium sp. H1 TaxID=3114757 RepID=UPI002E17275D|nr:efflux transporter outer membrane subunit [Uliginosibacterium sp. H1]
MATALILAGCSLAPTYERPAVSTPAAFKEAAVDNTQWKTATPAEAQARGEWWKLFGDATLDALQAQAAEANQDLKAATARLVQSRTLTRTARSEQMPQVGVGFGPTRQKPSPASQGLPADADTPITTVWRAQAGVSYEVDLFGRVASSVDAAQATAAQNEALFRSVQLALQADVAQAYFLIRELDAEQALLTRTVTLREDALRLVQKRFDAGDIGELDVARARTELAAAQSQSQGVARRRANAEHALALLLGKAPAEFALAPDPLTRLAVADAVAIPAGLPSALLERRPDIAAAERAMAAANARIGVARAAFFPNLTLTGAAGFESNDLGDLFNWSSRSFLLGPIAGTILSLPIFDGGRRQASLDRSRAAYEEDVASYRQTVLNAFREVEDNLAGLRILAEQTRTQDQAVTAAARAAQLSQVQYREGSVSYLDVIESDRSVLTHQRVAVLLDGERARAAVALVRALGGGWDAPVVADASAPMRLPARLAAAEGKH